MALTTKRIQRALRKAGRYRDSKNLYLQVVSPTNASWVFRYEYNHRQRTMGIGPYPTITIDRARIKAMHARRLLIEDIDPLEVRREEKAKRIHTLTFKECARRFYDLHRVKWKSAKHTRQFWSSLEQYAFPIIGEMPVSKISTPDILRVLQQLHKNPLARKEPGEQFWLSVPKTANATRGRMEVILSWAKSCGYRSGDNPAAWSDHLKNVLPSRSELQKVEHHAALPYSEIAEFMQALQAREGISARALELTILCATRTNETIGATWDEFNLAERTWTIPAARMKMDREHKVPLCNRAIAILEKLPKEHGNPFAFISLTQKGKGLSPSAMTAVLSRMKRDDITVHGFRSTFRDWCSECTAHSPDAAEMALAHSISSAVESAYRRGNLFEKRTVLMRDWEAFCFRTPATVTAISASAVA
jgi:integrase